MRSRTIAMAGDHAAVQYKQELKQFLTELEPEPWNIRDLGTHDGASVDYPDYGFLLAETVASGEALFGIALCGSGIGISIAANRHPAIRAAVCHDGLSAELARRHNDANVMALGARLIGIETAKDCIRRFVATEFEGGRHLRRVEKLGAMPFDNHATKE